MIQIETTIQKPPAFIWARLTENAHIKKWWDKGVTLEPILGGKFYKPWADHKGKSHIVLGYITDFEENHRLQMNWQEAGWAKSTRVEFVLRKGDNGTSLTLLHSGWDIFANEAERKKKVDEHTKVWSDLIDIFREYCLDDETRSPDAA